MFKKIFYLLLVAPITMQAQFYYKDLVSMEQTTELQKNYKTEKIRKVILNSFDPDEQPTANFICFQELSPTYNIIKTYTQSVASMQNVLASQFNAKQQLIRSADSSNTSLAITNYTYDAEGKLILVDVSTQSYAYKQSENEKHVWMYNEQKQPLQMLKIRNNKDTVMVKFKCNDQNQVIEEQWYDKNGQSISIYYYYYNEAKLLSDIVKFNDRARKLLPETIFEYNASAQLIQMLTVQSGTSNYLVWKYKYNEKGLKEKESCYNKQKQLLAYINYRYQ